MSLFQDLALLCVKLFVAVLLCEAVTEILVGSRLFEKPRDFAQKKIKFLGDLSTCGYCLSVWTGVGAAFLLRVQVTCTVEVHGLEYLGKVQPLLFGFVVHRLSNWVHEHFSEKRKLMQAQAFSQYYPDGQPKPGEDVPPVEAPSEKK